MSSIASEIELEIERLMMMMVFDLVWLPNSIELNPGIEFDWVRLSLFSERSIDSAGSVVDSDISIFQKEPVRKTSRGGYLAKFNTGRLRSEVQPLTLSYTI